jgi:activator of HSP90 ATPase
MPIDSVSRRQFSVRIATLLAAVPSYRPWRTERPVDVTSAEAIHQEVAFDATAARVYQVLTDAKQFSAMTKLSMVPKAAPAQIATGVGGEFRLFDGHILGRHVELVPNRRIVQAWRAADWPDGVYSIARFELRPQGAKTTIVFDHTGFPTGQGRHLAEGWHTNYWAPLKKHLR